MHGRLPLGRIELGLYKSRLPADTLDSFDKIMNEKPSMARVSATRVFKKRPVYLILNPYRSEPR